MGVKIHGTVDMSEDVYYKIYSSEKHKMTVVCLQWFDEFDYHQHRFVTDLSGDVHVFEREETAIEKLNEWYEPDKIDPKYRRGQIIDLRRD